MKRVLDWTWDEPARCDDFRALASCSLDAELDEFDAVRLQRHLADCPVCAGWMEQAESLTALLRASEAEQAPVRAVVPQVSRRRMSRAVTLVTVLGSTAAAGIVALIVALPMRNGSPQSSAVGEPCAWCMSHEGLAAVRERRLTSKVPTHVVNPVVRPIDTQLS